MCRAHGIYCLAKLTALPYGSQTRRLRLRGQLFIELMLACPLLMLGPQWQTEQALPSGTHHLRERPTSARDYHAALVVQGMSAGAQLPGVRAP